MDIEKVLSDFSDGLKNSIDKLSESISNSQMFERYKDSDDALADMLDDAGKAVIGVFDSLSTQVEPFIQNTKKKVYDSFYAEYKKAGEPYGSTHEGFMKWTDEREDQVREKVNFETAKARTAVSEGFQKARDYIDRELQNVSDQAPQNTTEKDTNDHDQTPM